VLVLAVCGFVGGVVFSVASAAAQTADGDVFMLEEISVTAQKRSQNQQKVGLAMDAISAEEMQQKGMTDIDQILSSVAGTMVNKTGDGLRVTIRGISQDAGGFVGPQSSAPTIAVNTDGVFSARNSSGTNLYDMERVEVLLGPQSTLYASNSPGGIVNIITADPKLNKYSATGSINLGDYDYINITGVVNAPISSQFGIRVAYSSSIRDGYIDNGGGDENKKSVRVKALYKPSEKMSFKVTAQTTRDTGKMGFASAVVAFEDEGDTDPWTAASDSFPGNGDKTIDKISGNIDFSLGFGDLSIIPSYSKTDTEYTHVQTMGAISTEGYVDQEGWEKGLETRIASAEDSLLDWIVGANYYKSEDTYFMEFEDGDSSTEINKIETKAIYANATYPVNEIFRVNAGLRKTWEETYQYQVRDTVIETEPEYDDLDYSAGVEYDFAENSMLYATYATGYRTQASMMYDGDGNAFPHETIESYTIGAKNRFFDDRFELNVSGYFYDYANYPADDQIMTLDLYDYNGDGLYTLTDVPDPANPGGTRDETQTTMDDYGRTVGDLDVYGAEIQTTTLITDVDVVKLNVSYLNSEFKDLYFDYMDITNSLGIPDVDYSGCKKTNSPEWTIDLSYNHLFNLANGGTLTANFDTRYQTEYFLVWKEIEVSLDENYNAILTPIKDMRTQEAYHLSNASLTYAEPEGRWTLTGYVKNIEDYAVKESWISGQMQVGSPRTYGVIFSVKID
jgi:iron complex outermembrane receptor protein